MSWGVRSGCVHGWIAKGCIAGAHGMLRLVFASHSRKQMHEGLVKHAENKHDEMLVWELSQAERTARVLKQVCKLFAAVGSQHATMQACSK